MRHEELLRSKRIVYGAFKGLGDLLSAAPVIASQLDLGHRVWLLCFPGKTMNEFIGLIDFGEYRGNLTVLPLPEASKLSSIVRFLAESAGLDPELVWISPHASRRASSWKIPLMLWTIKRLFWHRATIAGASSERLSFLFDLRAAVDRSLPLIDRERLAFSAIAPVPPGQRRMVNFVERITNAANACSGYDLLIHPGANARNRSWPLGHYAQVVALIPESIRIAVLGLPEDLVALFGVLPRDRNIRYLRGGLEDALKSIAQARVVLTMDSGNVHFATTLGVAGVALFGKADPATILQPGGSVLPIYQRSFKCQPCQRASCNQPQLYCMNSIQPAKVAAELLRLLDSRPYGPSQLGNTARR